MDEGSLFFRIWRSDDDDDVMMPFMRLVMRMVLKVASNSTLLLEEDHRQHHPVESALCQVRMRRCVLPPLHLLIS